ncbi:hypothetical protein SAMN05444678_103206 [Sphingomonas sp. YR710]|uniref:hypothetical protein n=1 Tax=Sphingomonas sp. YR710 TaxID=1882773 RepID=UPI0008908300|nr:hypothetical protein [Sphingomonas sp. YR710]SDC49946.1 hypothetical protein SAMN05444678_103206 [Sphingomonas sp. YR710]
MGNQQVGVDVSANVSGLVAGLNDGKNSVADLVMQVSDMTKKIVEGSKPAEVFGDHLKDLFSAISKISGGTSVFLEMMGGPWGAAIGAGISLAAALAEKLFAAGDGSEALAKRQEALAPYLDRTTGKMREQVGLLALLATKRDIGEKGTSLHQDYDQKRQDMVQWLSHASLVDRTRNPKFPVEEKYNIQNLLAKYASGKINVTGLYKAINQLSAADPANAQLKSIAERTLTLAAGVQESAQAFERNALEAARYAVAAGTATEADKKLVAANREVTASLPLAVAPPSGGRHPSKRTGSPVPAKFVPGPEPKVEEAAAFQGIADTPLPITPAMRADFIASTQAMYKQIGKIGDTTLDEQKAKWKGVADSIAGAWATSLAGMIKGTQNFRGMMLSIGNAILGEATKWIEKKASAFISNELTQTAAVLSGTASRNAIEASGAATSIGISATTSLTEIAHSAAVAASRAYKVIAGIQPYGPFIAPVVAAAALAGVMAFGKSIFSAEGGMGQVPYDGAMFELHKDEMVLPASLATPMRSMLAKDGTSGVGFAANDTGTTHNHYYNISAMDGQDVHRVLMRHHGSVARAAERAYRNGYAVR